MIKKNCKSIALFLLCSVLLLSCAGSKPKEKAVDPDFIGDFDPLKLEDFIALSYSKAGGLKPLEADMYFIPRNNNVELYFRSSANKIALVLSLENRDIIRSGAEYYLSAYSEENLPQRIPDKKNAVITGKTSLSWGLLGPGYTAEDVPFWINYNYLEEGRPYFMINFSPSKAQGDDSNFSPSVQVYFSPSQLNNFLEIIEQKHLESYVDELKVKAFTFE